MIAEIFNIIAADPRLSDVESLIGAEHIDSHGAPPRMIWVPTLDTFMRGQGRRSSNAREPQSVITRMANVRIRLWAKSDTGEAVDDFLAAEKLLNDVLVVIHDHCHGSFVASNADWLETKAGHLELGRAVDLTVSFEMPITRAPRPTTTITDGTPADMTGTFSTPNSDVTNSPSP